MCIHFNGYDPLEAGSFLSSTCIDDMRDNSEFLFAKIVFIQGNLDINFNIVCFIMMHLYNIGCMCK
jgi:hypothetical protein